MQATDKDGGWASRRTCLERCPAQRNVESAVGSAENTCGDKAGSKVKTWDKVKAVGAAAKDRARSAGAVVTNTVTAIHQIQLAQIQTCNQSNSIVKKN